MEELLSESRPDRTKHIPGNCLTCNGSGILFVSPTGMTRVAATWDSIVTSHWAVAVCDTCKGIGCDLRGE